MTWLMPCAWVRFERLMGKMDREYAINHGKQSCVIDVPAQQIDDFSK